MRFIEVQPFMAYIILRNRTMLFSINAENKVQAFSEVTMN